MKKSLKSIALLATLIVLPNAFANDPIKQAMIDLGKEGQYEAGLTTGQSLVNMLSWVFHNPKLTLALVMLLMVAVMVIVSYVKLNKR